MRNIGIVMYSLTVIYYGMMFALPTMYIGKECGYGFDHWILYLYIA